MKKLLLPAGVLMGLLLYNSCAKDKAQPPVATNCSTVNQSTNTYNLNIKTILDNNCASAGCHDAIFQSSGVNLATYDAAKTAFTTKNALCTVKQGSGCIAMPQGASKLADSLITYLECWSNNNYPQ